MARHFFRSSQPVARRRPVRRARTLSVLALSGAAAAYWLMPPLLKPGPDPLEAHFRAHRSDFYQLRTMVASEPSLESVGVENVGNFWLFDGRWTISGSRFTAYSRSEMLEKAGLAPARYQSYLDLLGRVGAYRVARQNGGRASLRGSVFLLPKTISDGGPVAAVVFAERPPEPLLSLAQARRAQGPAYARLDGEWYLEFNPR